MILRDGMRLYHGSYTIVDNPDLDKCRERKDFGKGFYLTTNHEQACRFTKTSIKKAIRDGVVSREHNRGAVSVYELMLSENLMIHEFQDADSEWLHCVAAHRSGREFADIIDRWKSYDIICGKIANDNTNLVIVTYLDGLYGEVMSEEADRVAIGFLEPDNLRDQICLRTEAALSCIRYLSADEVSI